MDHDSDDTPPDRPQTSRPDSVNRQRVRTNPHGIPVARSDVRPSRAHDVVDEPSEPEMFTVEQRVGILEGVRRGQRRLVQVALVAGLGSVGAVLVWMLNQRDATADERARIRYLEREVDRLGSFVYRSSMQLQREPPDYLPAPRSTAPRMDPAPKEPLP